MRTTHRKKSPPPHPTKAPAKPRRGRLPASRQSTTRVSTVPPLATEPVVLRRAEAAAMLRIGMTLLKDLIKQGRLRESRLGSVSLVHVDSIREVLGLGHDEAQS